MTTPAAARVFNEPAAGAAVMQRLRPRELDVERALGNGLTEALFRPPTAGLPLDPATSTRMEARLGTQLGDARVHVGPWASQSTRALGASAYALGNDVVFGAGRYAPSTRAGDILLGHELAHVVQQRGGAAAGSRWAAESAAWAAALGQGTVAPAGIRGIQLAEEGAEAAEAVRTAVQKPKVHPAFVLLLRNRPGALLAVYFTHGFVDGLVAEEVASERMTKLQARLMSLWTSPLDVLELYGGYLLGIGEGLISPITDIIDVVKLAVEFQLRITDWVITQGAALFGSSSLSIIAQAEKVKVAAEDAYDRAALALVNALEEPDFLANLLDRLQAVAFQKSYEGGVGAAKAWYEYWELPWLEVGRKMGYVVGMILIEVILAYFSAGIANAVKAAISAVAKLGRAGLRAVELLRKAISVIDDLWSGLKGFAKLATKTVMDDLAKAFGRLWDEFKKLWDVLQGKLDELAPSPSALTPQGVQVPIPVGPGPTVSLTKGTGKGGGGAPPTAKTKTEELYPKKISEAEVKGAVESPPTRGEVTPIKRSRKPEEIPDIEGPGKAQAIEAHTVARAKTVLGQRLTDNRALGSAWERAKDRVLEANPGATGSKATIGKGGLYDQTRAEFWKEVWDDAGAKRYFEDAGYVFPDRGRAPLLGEHTKFPKKVWDELRLSLDHTLPKATGDNWRFALDADKLEVITQADNRMLQILETRHPELKRW